MVDLAYGAAYFGDVELAGEVDILRQELAALSHQMRVVAVLAARTRHEAEGMAVVLQLIEAMEDLGRDAVDIASIASRGAGIPAGLVAVLSEGDSVLSRVLMAPGSALLGSPLSSLRLPLETGTRVIAVRRVGEWTTNIDQHTVLEAGDVVVLIGSQPGLDQVRKLSGTLSTADAGPSLATPPLSDASTGEAASDLDAAVEVLRKMKTLSEVAIGLAYAVLLAGDPAMTDEVRSLADQLDQLNVDMLTWVLQAASAPSNVPGLSSLLILAQAAEDLGDRAASMVQHIPNQQEMHPIVARALGESDVVVQSMAVSAGSSADGATLRQLTNGTGFDVLALRRDGRYLHRPARDLTLEVGDEVIATGPQVGRAILASRCGSGPHEEEQNMLTETTNRQGR